jgi:hypothetical protein
VQSSTLRSPTDAWQVLRVHLTSFLGSASPHTSLKKNGPLKLGRLPERHMRIEDVYGRLKYLHV